MDNKYTIELIGSAFELAGVIVLVIGSVRCPVMNLRLAQPLEWGL
jgi:hypothetical protein